MMGRKGGAALNTVGLLVGFIVLSQHGASDGFWWREETKVVTKDECRQMLKAVTSRSKVGFTKWYDVTPQQLEKHFGHPVTPDRGTYVSCWPEGTDLAEPDS